MEKKYLIGNDISTLEQWLDLMEKHPQDTVFEHYQFPTDALRQQFITDISHYSENIVKNILNCFLVPSGTLNGDKQNIRYFLRLAKDDPKQAKLLLEAPYYQRAIKYIKSKGELPIREGITWVVDLLPISPRESLDALNAYSHAHLPFLPDGRQIGLYDAQTIIRARYFSTDSKAVTSVFNSLKPIDLEYLIEVLYHTMGFTTKMTKRSHDEGIDIIATKDEPGKKEKNLIQCKKSKNVIGIDQVLQLLGVVTDNKATKGTLITTSYFSVEAEKKAKANPSIELIAFKELQQLLSEYLGNFWISHTDYLLHDSMKRHPLDTRE